MRLVNGEDLTPEQRQEVNNAFPYEVISRNHNEYWRAYFPDKNVWINCHAFWITKKGRLALGQSYSDSCRVDHLYGGTHEG
jgi:hypothetical protein